MRWCIYTLSCPSTGEVRYIGYTSQGLAKRISQHRSCARRGRPQRCYTWWRKCVREYGAEPIVEVVESGTGHDAGVKAEMAWIAYARRVGLRLTNHTDGGEGTTGYTPSDDVRASMSEFMKRIVRTDEWRQRIGDAHRGRTRDDAARSRMSAGIAKRIARGDKWGPDRRITDQEIADIRASVTGRKGERAALVKATRWSITTIDRALDESLWTIPDDVVGVPIEITPHEKWSGFNHPSCSTTPEQVREIRSRFDGGESVASIARSLGKPYNTTSRIARRQTFKDVA